MKDWPHIEQRPWPEPLWVRRSLRALGLSLDYVRIEPVGGRTAKVIGIKEGRQRRFCLVRQRCSDPRIVCPIKEEYEALGMIHRVCPGLVPEPLGLMEPDEHEALLALSWVDGLRLDSRLQVRERPEEVSAIIDQALSMFHLVGRSCRLNHLTRQVRVDRLLDAAENSSLRGIVAPRKMWDQAIEAARKAAQDLSTPTLLHGDAHLYNLMESPAGPCWLDFECLAVGPPELDKAHAWILLLAQAQRNLISPWRSGGQRACHLLSAVSFLQAPREIWSREARCAVELSLRDVIRMLQ